MGFSKSSLMAVLTASLVMLFGSACAQSPAKQPTPAELYGQATELAAEGRQREAVAALRKAVDAGFNGLGQLYNDKALDPLRDDPQFKSMVMQVRKRVFPCETDPRHRQFDFWAGNWDVFMANGNKAGENRIEIVEKGCVLEELWTGSAGGTGRSLNYYDPAKDRWVQQWVSSGGLIINIEGGLDDDGSMAMTGTSYYTTTGKQNAFRGLWTLLEDGRVRQFFEESYDGGETWSPWFEGFYVPRPSP
ncbi:MAG: hypothetical protein HKN49_11160 [Gammaproteobacteria bacterium]|nr:hypothetical protein [Gammaproteobacteria bacterium]